ncbi:MAG: polymerase subunit sigma-70 [Chloroflexi bacterium]|nr:polymerase subunit sigma-70 [Chloroflexota bacterium]
MTPLDPLAAVAAQVGHLQRLLDVYGPLLTDHQREACRLRLDEDWSYSELAETFGCTRSGAYDLVRRALAQLEHYEERLGHAAELARRDVLEAELRSRLLGQGTTTTSSGAA